MKNIKTIRKELNLSQKEIAKLLDMTQGTLSKIEKGKLFGENYKKYLEFLAKKGVDINRLF